MTFLNLLTKLFRRPSRPGIRSQSRHLNFVAIEQLEPRTLLAGTVFDSENIDLNFFRNQGSTSTVIGQQIIIAPTLVSASVTDGRLIYVDFQYSRGGTRLQSPFHEHESFPPFEAAGSQENFRTSWWQGWVPGEYVRVNVLKERLANLVAMTPRVNPDRSVTYGYRIDGDPNVAVRYRGYVEIELFYAVGPNKSDIRERIASSNLTSSPGGPIEFTVPTNVMKDNPAPAGRTHLVVVIDRNNQAAEYNENTADNVKAVLLPPDLARPNYRGTSLNIVDGKLRLSYEVNGASTQDNQNPVWAVVWAKEVTDASGATRIVKIGNILPASPTPLMLKSRGIHSYDLDLTRLSNRPGDATHLQLVVDYGQSVTESNESDNNTVSLRMRLQPGIYVGARDLKELGPLGQHQYVILVPRNPAAFPTEIRGLGDGTRGFTIGAHNRGHLQYVLNEDYDLAATGSLLRGRTTFRPEVDCVVLDSPNADVDVEIRKVLTAARHYANYPHRIAYPLLGIGTNSNSWAQSIIEHTIGTKRVREDFLLNDYGYWLRIGREYFIPSAHAVIVRPGTDNLLHWNFRTFSNGEERPGRTFAFGWTLDLGYGKDIPLFGDIDNDGTLNAVIVRPQANGLLGWYVDTNGDPTPEFYFEFGFNTDTPIIGDGNGDGFVDPVVVRKQANGLLRWYVDTNRNSAPEFSFEFGFNTDTPLLGDIDNDGKVNAIAVRKQSNGLLRWYVSNGYTSAPKYSFEYGFNDDDPIITDANFDGKRDYGVVRRASDNRLTWMIDVTGDNWPEIWWYFGSVSAGDRRVLG